MTVHGIKRRLERLEKPGNTAKVDLGGVPDEDLERAMSILDSYSARETGSTGAQSRAVVMPSASRVAMDAEVCAQCPAIVVAVVEQRER